MQSELRFWPELASLVADRRFRAPAREAARPAVLLIPGFLAGDSSLRVLTGWLRRRGHPVIASGIRFNVGCAGDQLDALTRRLAALHQPAVVIGQSRGGTLARALAARDPERVAALVMLGSPVVDQLAVAPATLRAVRSVARLGDLGVPGLFSSGCLDGPCCAEFRSLLRAPLGPRVASLAVYSRSDAIVDWRACLDPDAECVEVDSSHLGMGVNARVYEELERLLSRVPGSLASRS
ncbi:MAG: esterase/lipase family protein [Solirubrobacteraceae bacterium]